MKSFDGRTLQRFENHDANGTSTPAEGLRRSKATAPIGHEYFTFMSHCFHWLEQLARACAAVLPGPAWPWPSVRVRFTALARATTLARPLSRRGHMNTSADHELHPLEFCRQCNLLILACKTSFGRLRCQDCLLMFTMCRRSSLTILRPLSSSSLSRLFTNTMCRRSSLTILRPWDLIVRSNLTCSVMGRVTRADDVRISSCRARSGTSNSRE